MTMTLNSFADRLAWALEARAVGKSELARAAGVAPSAVTQWLNGDTKTLKAESLLRVAQKLRITPEWLLHGKGSRDYVSADAQAVGAIYESLPPSLADEGFAFLRYLIARADELAASSKFGDYSKMLEQIERDMRAKRHPDA